jgi:hypothetical protein
MEAEVRSEQPTAQRPLGIMGDVVLSSGQLTAFAMLETFDLGRVRDRLIADAAMPSTWVDEAIFEFRRYLGLHVVDERGMPMFSRHVDEVWHRCLLFSRMYADLCTQVFGRFLHHEPAMDGYEQNANGWEEFQAAYEALYGPIGRLWLMGRSGR